MYKTHLWLGIISGIVLFVVCLTGTVLVFEGDIISFLERDKHFVSHPGKSVLNLDDLVAKVEQDTNSKVILVDIDDRRIDTTKYYSMVTKTENYKNAETKPEIQIQRHSVDPYTGEIVIFENSFSPLGEFFYVVRRLHQRLFLPSPIGELVVGSATLIFVIITLSGFCLWLPANFRNIKAWKNGCLIRFRKGKYSLIFDLHKTLGFYALIPILLMALTGLTWSFQWYENGVHMVFAPYPYTPLKSLPKNPDAKQLPIGFFDKKADELLAPRKGGYRKIFFPEKEDDGVMIMEWRREGLLQLGGLDRIQFDQYTGEVLQFDNFDKFSISKKIVVLFPLIHYGSFLGLSTRIIFFIACLIATTLPITGVVIWWRKLRNLRKAKNKTE
ncbi:MAG: PepSY domain-containing protein [Planctomycetaceae bacterium]|nr:PepSY domain-containing protein [Planctomycetaceae bacterium]